MFLAVAAIPFLSFAQGCITIFSEDGDRFYLVLNGVKQNAAAQTNVRVDGLGNDYYSAKILFEDATKPEISKSIPVKDAATGQFADMTYKIKKTNKGELKIRYFSATPIAPNYTPPPDMYVVHYGQPAGAVTQTTQTTTVVSGEPAGANVNVNGGGVNMSINVNDPTSGGGGVNMSLNVNDGSGNAAVRQTTTTTTTSYSSTSTTGGNYNDAAPAKAGCNYPMDMSSFTAAKKTIKETGFEETKLSTAKSILTSNCVSTDQVMEICKLFGFEASKLDFAKFAYAKTTDKGNYFKVNNVFSFDASKTELNEYISH